MKVYIAARYSRKEEMVAVAKILRDSDIEVTSRWLKEKWNSQIKLSDVKNESLRSYALHDLEDIDSADVLIFFAEDPEIPHVRGGRHVEFGYAYGKGKLILVIGPKENVFAHLPNVKHMTTIREAIELLKLIEAKGE